jgi:hypothetical protein
MNFLNFAVGSIAIFLICDVLAIIGFFGLVGLVSYSARGTYRLCMNDELESAKRSPLASYLIYVAFGAGSVVTVAWTLTVVIPFLAHTAATVGSKIVEAL